MASGRGQVATEFFLYVSVFMFMAIAAYFVISTVESSEIPQTEGTIAMDTGQVFASSIAMAVQNGNGFTYNYTFPRTIMQTPYNLTFSPAKHVMVLDWQGSYGNFSQFYTLPDYIYIFPALGGCIKEAPSTPETAGIVYVFDSSAPGCSDILTLSNDGTQLSIYNGASQ
jgi:hypothetical protein